MLKILTVQFKQKEAMSMNSFIQFVKGQPKVSPGFSPEFMTAKLKVICTIKLNFMFFNWDEKKEQLKKVFLLRLPQKTLQSWLTEEVKEEISHRFHLFPEHLEK